MRDRTSVPHGGWTCEGGDCGEVGPNDCCEATGDGRMWSGL